VNQLAAQHSRPKTVPRHAGRSWHVIPLAIAALILVPVVALAFQASNGSAGLWGHLIQYVLPQAMGDTLMVLAGVGVLVTVLGTGTAWLVTAYDFPGRKLLQWALLLPLAVPTYIIAYAYLDLLHPLGPVQGAIRAVFGLGSPRDFRLPDIRSMAGCILLLGFVLYPYVYMTARAMFLTQAANVLDVSRSLGTGRRALFWRVVVPMARPAIAVGVSLALMEALNDIGASQFLGVRTLTVSIYSTWLTRYDLAGASQIALVMLIFIIALVNLERHGRRQQRFTASVQRARLMVPRAVPGLAGWGLLALGLVPVLLGFVFPALHLAVQAYQRVALRGLSPRILAEAGNTVLLAAIACVVVLGCGLAIAYSARFSGRRTVALASRISVIGYALPGTVVAIGILIPVAGLDRFLGGMAEAMFGYSGGLLILGSGAALIYAYTTRFLAVSTGGIEAGLTRIAPSLDHAARSLGQSQGGAFRRIHLPLSRPALVAAALLVFVDCVKELPATLLLRPLNFETLSTHLYGEAVRGTYEEASVVALIIVAIGILPVIFLADRRADHARAQKA